MPNFKKDIKGFRMKGWSPFAQDDTSKVHQTSPAPIQKVEKEEKFGDWIHRDNKSYSKHYDSNTAKASDRNSALTQYDPVKKPVGPVTSQTNADYMNRQVFNLVQDQERSIKDQISDLKGDIKILQKRGKSGDSKRIKTLQAEIKRLQS